MTKLAGRMDGVSGSAIRELFKLSSDPGIIAFGGGNPARESFPIQTIQNILDKALKENGASLLQYGITEGYIPLRKAVIEHLLEPKGLSAGLENVLIVSGSMQSLDLITKIYVDPGDTILVESPTFLGALQAFRSYQGNLVPVPMDEDGVIISELERLMKELHPKLFYCIPTFQNPTGRTLKAERREKIAQLAEKYDCMVIEDDPYGELRYEGEVQPPIKSFDKSDHVILLLSFSKIIAPGIRVGALIGPSDIVRKLTISKQSADTHTSNVTQVIAAEFLAQGLLPGHIKSIIPIYSVRLQAMLNAIEKYFPKTCRYTVPEGGLFVWGEMEKGVKMLPIFERAVKEEKVAFVPGEHFFTDCSMGENTFRLNFSSETPERIEEGIKRLGKILKEA
ncbi:MAG: PLP-dependent aminotransferase family protein [Clostridia bacterium]